MPGSQVTVSNPELETQKRILAALERIEALLKAVIENKTKAEVITPLSMESVSKFVQEFNADREYGDKIAKELREMYSDECHGPR